MVIQILRNAIRLRNVRSFSVTSRRASSKYLFYDLLLKTATHPQQPIEALLMTDKELADLKKTTKTTTEEDFNVAELTADEKIARVFGGRIKGETRESSSRMNVGKPRMIAGVKVPDRPMEPDNCCMSGCINCVWELYNDDVKEWNAKRKEAAEKLSKKGGVWPADFHPPVQFLKPENLPGEFARPDSDARKLEENEAWGNVPVLIRVFAEMEKKMREKRKQREAAT